MTTKFTSPVYAELAFYIVPKAGATPKRVKAHRGVFEIADADLKAFRKHIADRPQYNIEEIADKPVEKTKVDVTTFGDDEPQEIEIDATIDAADDEADADEDDLDDEEADKD